MVFCVNIAIKIQIIFAVNVHIINVELIIIDFYFILDWLFYFINIFNILIKVHIINLEIVHNKKYNCKCLIKKLNHIVISHIYSKRLYKQWLIIYSLINYLYHFSIWLKCFKHHLSNFSYFNGRIVWSIQYFFEN